MRDILRRVRDETGSASVAFLLVFPPVLLGLLVTLISAALYYYGGTAAITIAQTGAAAAAAEHGSTSACRQAGRDLARRVSSAIHDVQVSCTRSATTVTVTVTGTPLSLISSFSPSVTHTASVEVERLTGP